MIEDLLVLRKNIKKVKPKFHKQSSHKKLRLKKKWRRPRGSDSKIRVNKKGYPRKIKIGFKGPKLVRNLDSQGLNKILIKTIDDLKSIKKDKDIACLSGIGKRKKINIVKKCLELGFVISNLKDPKKFLEETEKSFIKKKEDKKKKLEEKEKQKKKADKKKEGIEAKIEEKSDEKEKSEEQRNKDKKEKDKLLTKKEIWNLKYKKSLQLMF